MTNIYAGFWKRAAALVIDSFLLGMITSLLGHFFHLDELTQSLINIALFFSYFSIMESSPLQATLGKLLLRIKVTDTDGNRVSFWRALFRNVDKIASLVILYVGFIMAGFTPKKQALHDMLAGTLVVNKNAVLALKPETK